MASDPVGGAPAEARKHSFAPVVDPATRLLVLGSLPGAASLAVGRYYAHPRNQFWTLIGAAIEVDLAPLDYGARLTALRHAGIGLWDTVASARRRGSLDGAIREMEPHPLAELVARLPALRAVAFNGAAAARIGRRSLGTPGPVPLIVLPSSSPAYCRVGLAEKREQWRMLLRFLAD